MGIRLAALVGTGSPAALPVVDELTFNDIAVNPKLAKTDFVK